VDWVVSHPRVIEAFGVVAPVSVRARKGQLKAHYEAESQVIAIPLDTAWAARESVVLHELTHHIVMSSRGTDDPAHGPRFTASMCTLVECTLGPEAALLLRATYSSLDLATVMP
jgi:putative metallohydrolase (TIGR04338 family)